MERLWSSNAKRPLAGKSVASLPDASTVYTSGRWRLTLFGYMFLASSGGKTVQETLRKRHHSYLYYTTMHIFPVIPSRALKIYIFLGTELFPAGSKSNRAFVFGN